MILPESKPLAVSPTEAARLIGCGRTMIYQLIGEGGALPSFTLGRRRLIRLAAIEAWIMARESGGGLDVQ